MPIGVPALLKRVERVDHKLEAHLVDDASQFGQLREAITNLGVDLGNRIDSMADGLQAQIDEMTKARIRAEGKAEGLAEATATAAKPAWWHPWARWAVGAIVAGAVALIATMASTIWNLEQSKIEDLKNRPAASVTVNPAQQPTVQAPAPENGQPVGQTAN